MEGWSASPVIVFCAVLFGLAVAAIVIWLERQYRRRYFPKTVSDWLPALEQANMGVVNATAHLAGKVKELVVLREQMADNPECQRIADQVLAYTQVVEEQLFEELAKRGIVPRYMFGGPVSHLQQQYRSPGGEAQDSDDDQSAVVVDAADGEQNIIQLPTREYETIGRQLVRRRTP